jgi:catalase
VFFIQDAILFPDLIHAVKPKPDREIPQGATAHDSAWDFFSQQPSSLHTLFWAMAGNGIPRSYRHMDGFGIHTFRLVTDQGDSKLVKWHWKSKQGKASLVWEEAQVLAGKNADVHRADLWDAISSGNGPEWELGVQIVDEKDELSFGFDLLDPTKIIPEELVPVTKLGVMKLDTNPTNYFAETEQVMACSSSWLKFSRANNLTVPTRPHRTGHRFYGRPTPPRSHLLLPRYPAQSSRWTQLRTASNQPTSRSNPQQQPRRRRPKLYPPQPSTILSQHPK